MGTASSDKGPTPPELPKVQLQYPSLVSFAKAARKTFKLGWMTLKTMKELTEGNRVGLSFRVPERGQPIEIIGEVIDVVAGVEGQANTYGIRFLNFSEKKLVRLLELEEIGAAIAPPAGPAPTPPAAALKATPPPSPPVSPYLGEDTEVFTIDTSDNKVPTYFDDRAYAPSESKLPIEKEVFTIEKSDGKVPTYFDDRASAAAETRVPIKLDSRRVPAAAERVSAPGPAEAARADQAAAAPPAPAEELVLPAPEPPTPEPALPEPEAVPAPEPLSAAAAEAVAEEVPTPETAGLEAKPLTPAEYEALGNFLLRFTRQVLQSGQPVPAKTLWEEFRALMAGRDELGLYLRLLPAGKDFMLEGTAAGPVSLKTVIPRELAADLLPKLAELLDRKKILGLTLRRYLSEAAFSEALRLLAEYGPETSSPGDLVAGLLKAGAFHFALIFIQDRIAESEDLSWRPALFLTRLAGDLRRLDLFVQSLSEEPRAVLTMRVEDALKTIRDPSLLAEILVHCEQAAAGQDEFDEADLQSEIVFAVPLEALVQTVEVIAEQFEQAFAARQSGSRDPKAAAREPLLRRTLRRAVTRLAYEAVESGMKILSRLYRKQVLGYEELPEVLRDRVDAEREADDCVADLGNRLAVLEKLAGVDEYHRQSRKLVHVLLEFVRRDRMDLAEQIFKVLAGHRTEKAPPFLERPGLSREAMGIFGEAASLEILVLAFQSDQKEVRERVASMLYAAGEPAVPALLDVLAQSGERSVRKLACDVLTRLGERVAAKIHERIFRSDTAWYLTRNLVMVLGDMKSGILIPEIESLLLHEHARVRGEALAYLMKVGGPEPEPRLVRGLFDPDPLVRRQAVQLLGQLPALADAALLGLLGIVEKKSEALPGKDEELGFVQALDLLSRKKPGKLPDGRSLESVVLPIWEAESVGFFKRLGGARPKQTLRMRAAICEAMGRIGSDKCRNALKEAGKDKEELVRRAAKAALERGQGTAKIKA